MKQFIKLKANYDFRRIYKKGKAIVCPYFVMYVAKGRKEKLRLGITAGKKVGGAVERNRAKRVIYAAFRAVAQNIPMGNDIIIVARTKILTQKSTCIEKELERQLKSNDFWYEDEKPVESISDKAD